MSNALETKLRALINELQGLYKQCAADIAKLKERKDYSMRAEVLFVSIKNHLSKSMEIRHNQFRILMARIEQLEDITNQIKEKLCSLEEKIKKLGTPFPIIFEDREGKEIKFTALIKNIKNGEIYEKIEVLKSEFKEAYNTLNNFTKDVVNLEEKLNRIVLPENNTTYHLDGFNQSFIDLFQQDELINLVLLEILKWAKFEDEDKRNYIKDELKELERNIEYYDERTLTHFISDINDWIESHKFREDDSCAYWYIDVSNLEQYLIDRKKQMMKYNKEITKKQLGDKQ